MPCLVPDVTTALTISPVWKPLTFLAPLGFEQGKPISLTLHMCLHPCPVAVISKGETPLTCKTSGVLWPTHDASSQCVLSKPLVTRLNLVSPPLPSSTGRPNACRRWHKCRRVVLTALASLNGAFAWARRRLSTSGCFARNVRTSCLPFAVLHGSQARHRLLMRLVPPLVFA